MSVVANDTVGAIEQALLWEGRRHALAVWAVRLALLYWLFHLHLPHSHPFRPLATLRLRP